MGNYPWMLIINSWAGNILLEGTLVRPTYINHQKEKVRPTYIFYWYVKQLFLF